MPLSSDSKLQATLDAYHASDWWLGFKLIKPITKENLKKGTGAIELLKPGTPLGLDEPQADKPEIGKKLMPFGKYKGKSKEWIEENDPQYARWADENLPIWRKL